MLVTHDYFILLFTLFFDTIYYLFIFFFTIFFSRQLRSQKKKQNLKFVSFEHAAHAVCRSVFGFRFRVQWTIIE